MQLEIYYQNYESFYPSELFTLDHFFLRQPVGSNQIKLVQISSDSFLDTYSIGWKKKFLKLGLIDLPKPPPLPCPVLFFFLLSLIVGKLG